jgi:biotin synthase
MDRPDLLRWLREDDEARLEDLWRMADETRRGHVGDAVHLRGLIEISNHCVRSCGYCGLRAAHRELERYRMSEDEILQCARDACEYGYGTVVIQSGEDYGIAREWMVGIIQRIKRDTGLAVTLSLGERPDEDLAAWRDAGADRYLLRFETSDAELYRRIHPSLPDRPSDRIAILRTLKALGYEAGGGAMIGIPGQTYDSLANDIATFAEMDLDMVGVGPYIAHPATPMGKGEWVRPLEPGKQVLNTETMAYKVVALTRLACPEANIPSTTALATINADKGWELGLIRGANVVMPNLTPARYRALYEIYPDKAGASDSVDDCLRCLQGRIESIGRKVGTGPGGRNRSG